MGEWVRRANATHLKGQPQLQPVMQVAVIADYRSLPGMQEVCLRSPSLQLTLEAGPPATATLEGAGADVTQVRAIAARCHSLAWRRRLLCWWRLEYAGTTPMRWPLCGRRWQWAAAPLPTSAF